MVPVHKSMASLHRVQVHRTAQSLPESNPNVYSTRIRKTKDSSHSVTQLCTMPDPTNA